MSVAIASGKRPVPFRTRKLSPTAPMVLHSLGCGRVGHRRHFLDKAEPPGHLLGVQPFPRVCGRHPILGRRRLRRGSRRWRRSWPRAIMSARTDKLRGSVDLDAMLPTAGRAVHRLRNFAPGGLGAITCWIPRRRTADPSSGEGEKMLNETVTTVVGNVITDVKQRRITDGTRVASFRVASNERRFDKESQSWVNGDSLYVTVTCWR